MFVKTEKGFFFGNFTENYVLQGNGIMLYNDGSVYRGGWKNDQMEGFGELVKRNGNAYIGFFKNGKLEGFGQIYYAKKNMYYTGEIKNNKKDGKGCLTEDNKKMFEGLWKKDKKHGFGIQFKKNMKIKGQYLAGKKNGNFEVEVDGKVKCFIEYKYGKEVKVIKTKTNNLIENLSGGKKINKIKEWTIEELKKKYEAKLRKKKIKNLKFNPKHKQLLATPYSQKLSMNNNIFQYECRTSDSIQSIVKPDNDDKKIDLFTYFDKSLEKTKYQSYNDIRSKEKRAI